ncbi:hypothetical protein FRIG_03625 [Frigoribacterium faeni]|uniref:hypothetical protein n=1 Tax=Frigoribacterium faeni TaxID=145483 RepID=UPI001FAB6C8D|nr:hypothetical protein [Frigoribacterium faeni]MCJ0700231.1 hypothetical protein [Frigoribacterium faeni]
MNNVWKRRAVISVSALALVGAGSFVLAGQASSEPLSTAGPAPLSSYDVAALTAGQTEKDVLPADAQLEHLGVTGLNASSTRWLSETAGSTVWGAQDNSGAICLVASIPGEDAAYASSCADAEGFAEHGVALRVLSPTEAAEAYLVPDSVQAEVEGMLAPVAVDDNARSQVEAVESVFTVDPEATTEERADLNLSTDGFELRTFDAPADHTGMGK